MLNMTASATDGLPIPVKAITQTVLLVIQYFEAVRDAKDRAKEIIQRALSLWNSLVEHYKEGVSEKLDRHVQSFLHTLQRTLVRLLILRETSQLRRILAVESVNSILDDADRAINNAKDTLNVSFLVSIAMVVHEKGVSTSITPALLPPVSRVFHGRDSLVQKYVQVLCAAQGFVGLAIMGPGGVGKTSVALRVLHNDILASQFDGGRFFMSCEPLSDAADLPATMATHLGLDLPPLSDPLTAVVYHLRTRGRTLLVIDNLETIWDSEAVSRATLEDQLRQLEQLSNIGLIITSRGAFPPYGVDWANRDEVMLSPLSPAAALQVFIEVSRTVTDDPAEIAARDNLLAAVDYMPLAISLLAQLAARGESPTQLLESWEEVHTRFLRTHPKGKSYNIEVSIQLSLDALVRYENPEALGLLAVCSHLPDGMRPAVYDHLKPIFRDIKGALRVLQQLALVNTDHDSVTRMLNPVRLYVHDNYEMRAADHLALLSFYLDLAAAIPSQSDDHYFKAASHAAPEYQNLYVVLSSEIRATLDQSGHVPLKQLVDAVIGFCQFGYRPMIADYSSLQRLLQELIGLPQVASDPLSLARCLRRLAFIDLEIGNYVAAADNASKAQSLYLQIQDHAYEAADCTFAVARATRWQGDYEDADSCFANALGQFVQLGNIPMIARCTIDWAYLAADREDWDATISHGVDALKRYIECEGHHGMAICAHLFGRVFLRQGRIDGAVKLCYAAAYYRTPPGIEELRAYRDLSIAYRHQRKFQLALDQLAIAQDAYTALGDIHDLAICTWYTGLLHTDQGQLTEGERLIRDALSTFERLGIKDDYADCKEDLEDILRADKGDDDEALPRLVGASVVTSARRQIEGEDDEDGADDSESPCDPVARPTGPCRIIFKLSEFDAGARGRIHAVLHQPLLTHSAGSSI
ncbi:hypothetical protein B0H16DRAFT_590141 [Mycena metata]|uniref:Novel STAND NTPase 1 domain-containing protein n=1 Tax=Mycena metata TaxID=1033252 RepID=A0AAD7MDE4_9AGAR|nr:hypothetical protein B0H16DRAFT_590141 [Mycena metata]